MGLIKQETRVIGVHDFENIQNDLADLKKMILKKTQHPYLMKYIPEPVIDDDKLLFLYLIYKEADLSEDEVKEYVLTTMLVQIALDTHETVTIHNDESDDHAVKNRQLTVLAGDYYSGLYYHLLAELSDIRMISVLATAIKEINEHKISVYRDEADELGSMFHSLACIESALVQRAADYFGLKALKEAAYEFFSLKRLLQERQHLLRNNGHSIFQVKRGANPESGTGDWKSTVVQAMNKSVRNAKDSLEMILNESTRNGDMLEMRLNELFDLFKVRQEKLVEEGS